MPTPGSRVPGERPGDPSLRPGLVSVDENLLSFRTQPYSPAFGLDGCVFGAEPACAQERHDGLVDEEGAELFHEVEGQAGAFVGWRVSDSEGRIQPGGVECADAFAEEDGVPVGQCGVGQVAGWASAAPVEGNVGEQARGERAPADRLTFPDRTMRVTLYLGTEVAGSEPARRRGRGPL